MAGSEETSPSNEANEWSDFTSNSSTTDPFFCDTFCPNASREWPSVDSTFTVCFPSRSDSSPAVFSFHSAPTEYTAKYSQSRVLDQVDPSLALYGQPLVWWRTQSQKNFYRALNLSPLEQKNHVPSWQQNKHSEFISKGTFDFHKLAEKFTSQSSTQRWSRNSNKLPEDFVLSKSPDTICPAEDSDSNEEDEIFLVFRGKPNSRPSSFDECQAAAGLAHLSLDELLDLKEEMSAYMKEYSDVLIEELTLREEFDREKEVKNRFISVLLSVQSKIRELQTVQGKGKKGSSANSGKFLTTVIPYDDCTGGPSTKVLLQLIDIMEALIADSPIVPGLLTEYILKVWPAKCETFSCDQKEFFVLKTKFICLPFCYTSVSVASIEKPPLPESLHKQKEISVRPW